MVERPVAFEGANLGLVIAVVAVSVAATLILLGPGQQRVGAEREILAEAQKRIDAWGRQQEDLRDPSAEERAEWERTYSRLARFGAPVTDDDAALMAWVAGRLDAPSVEDLQVSRARTREADEEEDESSEALVVPRPDGEQEWELLPVPLRVRFDAGYADAASLLRRLGSQLSPIQIERLEMRRHYPKVRVELDVTLWTHREATS